MRSKSSLSAASASRPKSTKTKLPRPKPKPAPRPRRKRRQPRRRLRLSKTRPRRQRLRAAGRPRRSRSSWHTRKAAARPATAATRIRRCSGSRSTADSSSPLAPSWCASAGPRSRREKVLAWGAMTRSLRSSVATSSTSGCAKTAVASPSSRTPKRADGRHFVDSARIAVRGGHGGKGSASFRREPYTPRGGPDGGDGGPGGSVVLQATNHARDLSLYTQRRRWNAEPGADCARGRQTRPHSSHHGPQKPVGTIALDSEGSLIADLDRPGARVRSAEHTSE